MTRRFSSVADPATERTVTALLTARASRLPSGVGQWALGDKGRWEPVTWSDYESRVADIGFGLRALGLQPGQAVAVLAAGSPAWDQIHLGVLAARGILVGLDAHASSTQLETMFALAKPRVAIVDDLSVLSRVGNAALDSLHFAIVVSPGTNPEPAPERNTVTLGELLEVGRREDGQHWDEALPNDPAWVVFTSGTTGLPKGLIYRHWQVREAIDAIVDSFDDIAEGARLVSWLPLSNPFQRIINLCALARGAETYYVSDPREVMRHLPMIRPHVFIAVPRFFEKFYALTTSTLERSGPLRSRVARWALRVGERQTALQREGESPSLAMRLAHRGADALVLRRIRAAFGGELRYLVSGSAAMPLWLLERLHAMGLLVLEAYGLSECIVPVASNRVGAFRFGSVGRPMNGNRVRLAKDGELLLKSDGVFEGYMGSSDDSDMVNAEGWLATGDFAEVDDEGFIRLVGRKSEVFKTSTGRRVAPGAVEAVLRSVPGVENAAVFGAGRKSLLAVVSLASDSSATPASLRDGLRRTLQALPDYQRPAGLVVSHRPFTVDAGELTGNLKLRRHAVRESFAVALEALANAVDAPAGEPGGEKRDLGPGDVELIVL